MDVCTPRKAAIEAMPLTQRVCAIIIYS